MRKNIALLTLIFTYFVPFFAFGHLKGIGGWPPAFLFYSIYYFFLGFFARRTQMNVFLYHFIVGVPLVGYSLFLYIEAKEFYFPMITPALLCIGFLSYLLGFGFVAKKTTVAVLGVLFLTMQVVYCNYAVLHYLYLAHLDSPNFEHLLNKPIHIQLKNLKQENVPEEHFKNKVVVLDFWHSQCGNCMVKLQQLDELYEHFIDNPNIIIASVINGKIGKIEDGKKLVMLWKVKHPVYYDSMGIFINQYQIGNEGYPNELRIDSGGNVKQIFSGISYPSTGGNFYFEKSITYIEQLLKK